MAKILIADDERTLVNIIRINLEIEGFEVDSVYDGQEALEMIEKSNYDLLILDVMMPNLSGISLATKLRKDPQKKSIPIIFLTAKVQETDIKAGLSVGDKYITKPFEPQFLAKEVKTLLRQKKG
ncbi:MAG: response regulator [Candidatus Subteraquimicrobiales bacterium]|nr:response regulator [Candidatus Subteraquimicrobiales bacterium]